MQVGSGRRGPSFDEGSLDQYLREISKYPLIPQEEEVNLAQRIRTGEGEALDKLVRSNLRFVVSVAKKYQNQGVSLADLINEGNLGLIRAAHKFDETKGIKFISYAVWWIRQAILQALAEQSRIVRVPLNRAGTLHRIGKRSSALLQELGREPTPSEIAEGMDISMEEALPRSATSAGIEARSSGRFRASRPTASRRYSGSSVRTECETSACTRPAGMLSMQYQPRSSSMLSATLLPEPDSPLTTTRRIICGCPGRRGRSVRPAARHFGGVVV
jgi:RNA polymerase sigma factor (sigma-70 family)